MNPDTTPKPIRKHIDGAEVSKLIKRDLKAAFPKCKFSVKLSRYSGGSSIRVCWLNGPTQAEVEAKVGHYHGASFDGMIDLKSYHDTLTLTAEGWVSVHYGNDYLFFEREFTAAFLASAVEVVKAKYGSEVGEPVIKSHDNGEAYLAEEGPSLGCQGRWEPHWTVRSVVMRQAREMSEVL